MALPQVQIAALDRSISCLMAAPSSAEPDSQATGLDRYRAMGGNCIHLHGEGGETHSRIGTGKWLAKRNLRPDFVLCTQICHDEWDEQLRRPLDRFTPAAVAEDIATDLELLGTDYVDLVYLDDRPNTPFEPMIDALAREVEAGRIRAFGVRNWTAERIRAANGYALAQCGRGFAALVTTELALPIASAPMWPGYVPFDDHIMDVSRDLNLTVLAHAGDVNIGQCLFGDEMESARWRPEWISRWNLPVNKNVAVFVKILAAERGVAAREVNLAWIFYQRYRFPVVAVVGLPELFGPQSMQYQRASQLDLDNFDLRLLDNARDPLMRVLTDY